MVLDFLKRLIPKNQSYTVGGKTTNKIPIDVELKIDNNFKRTLLISSLLIGVGIGVGVGVVNKLSTKNK